MKMISPLEVGLGVRDLPRMRHFYETALGCRFVSEVAVPAGKARQAALSGSGYTVVRLQTSHGERIKLLGHMSLLSKVFGDEQRVAAAEDGHQDLFDHRLLADDHPPDFLLHRSIHRVEFIDRRLVIVAHGQGFCFSVREQIEFDVHRYHLVKQHFILQL